MNQKAYDKLDYTLALLSAAADGKRQGCIVNSLHQATSSFPPQFTVTVNKSNETCKALESAGTFCATLLSADCPDEIINQFGYKSGRVGDKFASYQVETDGAGNPYLKASMVSRISCRITGKLEIGNYILFVGEVTESEVLADGPALTLQAFTNRGKAVPPQATVYRTVEIHAWRCTVCGYVYEGEFLPPDFRCPVCGATADKFVRVDEQH